MNAALPLLAVAALSLSSCEALRKHFGLDTPDGRARNSHQMMLVGQQFHQQQMLQQQMQYQSLENRIQFHEDMARRLTPVRVEHSGRIEVEHSGNIRIRR